MTGRAWGSARSPTGRSTPTVAGWPCAATSSAAPVWSKPTSLRSSRPSPLPPTRPRCCSGRVKRGTRAPTVGTASTSNGNHSFMDTGAVTGGGSRITVLLRQEEDPRWACTCDGHAEHRPDRGSGLLAEQGHHRGGQQTPRSGDRQGAAISWVPWPVSTSTPTWAKDSACGNSATTTPCSESSRAPTWHAGSTPAIRRVCCGSAGRRPSAVW